MPTSSSPFRYSLNTSTIKGQGLPLVDEIELAASVGYDGIEPWIKEIDTYTNGGGSLPELGERLADLGLIASGAIGFFEWCVDDDAKRKAGLVEAERNMEMVRQIGGNCLAAPPFGAQSDPVSVPLDRLAERYAELLALGEKMGVTPLLELWGFSRTLGNLADTVHVALATGRADARMLLDVYHLYKGGSAACGLDFLSADAIGLFHVNDYPAEPPRETIVDAQRVWPGDGIAPLDRIFGTLHRIGYRGFLSVELFNQAYWEQDAVVAARDGLVKTKAAVDRALAAS